MYIYIYIHIHIRPGAEANAVALFGTLIINEVIYIYIYICIMQIIIIIVVFVYVYMIIKCYIVLRSLRSGRRGQRRGPLRRAARGPHAADLLPPRGAPLI